MSPGKADLNGLEYYRHGLRPLYAAPDTKIGIASGKPSGPQHYGAVGAPHRHRDASVFAKFVALGRSVGVESVVQGVGSQRINVRECGRGFAQIELAGHSIGD